MLWNYFKHLKSIAPIYIGIMDEDENSIPENYVILEDQTFDEGHANGDGINLLRKSTYNIRIYSRTKKKADEIVNKYRTVLIDNRFQFNQFGPTYDPTSAFYSTLITGAFIYGNQFR